MRAFSQLSLTSFYENNMNKQQKKQKSDAYKPAKGRQSPQHSTKVVPNKKKTKMSGVIQFDNADVGIGE